MEACRSHCLQARDLRHRRSPGDCGVRFAHRYSVKGATPLVRRCRPFGTPPRRPHPAPVNGRTDDGRTDGTGYGRRQYTAPGAGQWPGGAEPPDGSPRRPSLDRGGLLMEGTEARRVSDSPPCLRVSVVSVSPSFSGDQGTRTSTVFAVFCPEAALDRGDPGDQNGLGGWHWT
jgi:hypothetical protein